MISPLDAIIQRLQSVDAIRVEAVGANGEPFPWRAFTAQELVADLVVGMDLRTAIDSLAAQIMFWGRIVATTRRVHQIRERRYRVWRSEQELHFRDVGAEPTELGGKPKKGLTVGEIEALIRQLPEYALHQTAIEAAEETWNASTAVYDAWKAKRDMLRIDVRREVEGGMGRYSY